MCPSEDVASPAHYNCGGLECIDAIEASMGREEFLGYLKGNVLKYLWRYRYKGDPEKDLQKANWYLTRLQRSNPSFGTENYNAKSPGRLT